MRPEFVSHESGPHARVKCVECHVAPGASGLAQSKLAGTRRLLAAVRQTYPRPIVPEAGQLLPARDTCEHCHSAELFHGDKIRRVAEYSDNDQNTESVTTLRLHVGGGDGKLGTASGIHWHMNIANEIEYIATDRVRQTIPYVRMKDRDGRVREFAVAGVTPEQLAKGERRRMDCMDCHNRPSHVIAATAERAVNDLMARGAIPLTLPFVHREAVKALKANNPAALREFYRGQPEVLAAHAADVDRAASAVEEIFRRNVFPEMNVGFGTYPNNIGHVDSLGCFRCHDDEHKSKEGKAIGQDCEICHAIE
jgi:hypothetical protein